MRPPEIVLSRPAQPARAAGVALAAIVIQFVLVIVGERRMHCRRDGKRLGGRIIVGHEAGPDDQEQTQHDLNHPRPGRTDRFFFR